MAEDRELTEPEAAILDEAQPETEAEALTALGEQPVETCSTCRHTFQGVCQRHGAPKQVSPNGHCSLWE